MQTATARSPSLRFATFDGRADSGLRLAVALAGSPGSEQLVLLRSEVGSRTYLGSVLDAGDRVIEWIEVWVQVVGGLADSPATWRDRLSNALLDAEWSRHVREIEQCLPDVARLVGREHRGDTPTWVDPESGSAWRAVERGTGHRLALCTDDGILTLAGLPSYGGSLHRYAMAVDGQGTPVEPVLYPLTPGAPRSASTRELAPLLPEGRRLVPFNPEGGRLAVRRFAPVPVESYIDLLGGRPWMGQPTGGVVARLPEPYAGLAEWDTIRHETQHLFMGGRGLGGVVVESLHLRLSLVYQLFDCVARSVGERQLPLLNLSADSFGVELGPKSPSLPLLWTARVRLGQPGSAISLPLSGTKLRFFLPLDSPAMTIFRPEYLGLPVSGRARVRLRRVGADNEGSVSVEGTLVTSELPRLTVNDLVWLKVPLPGGVLDLYAHLDSSEGLATGESRFRSLPRKLDANVTAAVRRAEGNVFDGTQFETVPLLSSPCDLYALGVLAVRALLVNRHNSLGVALDEVQSLARQLGAEATAEPGDVAERVAALAAEDSRWLTSLGPHRLWDEGITPEEGLSLVPEALWWRVVSVIARCFPGHGPDGYCRDFGDFPPFALEQVFARPLQDLERLVHDSRGLLLSDWTANREVAAVLQKLGG